LNFFVRKYFSFGVRNENQVAKAIRLRQLPVIPKPSPK
jgi:hypothetical protein